MEHAITPVRLLTADEYLEFEETSPVRHEYIEGHLYALAGVSSRHDDIVVNLIIRLGIAAQGGRCKVNSGELKLRVSPERFYYPDVAVYCDPDDSDTRIRTNPCVVIEVLSPSTEGTDRREKLFAYQGIASLRAYLIVHQDERRVERYWRAATGPWRQEDIAGDAAVPIPCLDFDLSLADIYEGVRFDES